MVELLVYRCGECEKKKQSDLDEYTRKIFWLRRMQTAKYPFGPNDLTLEEWEDLGAVEETMKWQTKTQSP